MMPEPAAWIEHHVEHLDASDVGAPLGCEREGVVAAETGNNVDGRVFLFRIFRERFRHDDAGTVHQRDKEIEFLGRKRYGLTTSPHRSRHPVDLNLAETVERRSRRRQS